MIRTIEEHQRDLRRALNAAKAADKAKAEFLANMSHEIRTPMNGILGAIQLVLGDEPAGENRELLEAAVGSAESLLALLDNLLSLSSMEAGELQLREKVFRIAPLVQRTATMFQAEATI